MNLRIAKLAGTFFTGAFVLTFCGLAQIQTSQPYTLIKGSQLTDDCPICDRIPIVVPMTGTFDLRMLEENPLETRYELSDIALRAGANPGSEYQVLGNGSYQVGGEVAVLQDVFLELEISNGFSKTKAQCVNPDRTWTSQWPKLQIYVDQTNGTPAQVYHLALVAIPVPQVQIEVPDPQVGDVLLKWEGYGGEFQLERATDLAGPYTALTPFTTKSAFTDVGVLTNYPQLFYRLRQF
jgi:hypothetical protein